MQSYMVIFFVYMLYFPYIHRIVEPAYFFEFHFPMTLYDFLKLLSDDISIKLFLGGALLFLSIFSSKISMKIGVPILLFFLGIGIIAHFMYATETHNTKLIEYEYAKLLGVMTLTFILFSGGLETDMKHVRPILRSGILLSTVGAAVTALVIGLFLYSIGTTFGDACSFSFKEGILIGAIIASTDAAAVFSILRSRKIHLKSNIGPLLELESGSNDVIVHFLMCLMISLLGGTQHGFMAHVIPNQYLFGVVDFIMKMGIGGACGFFAGHGMRMLMNKINIRHKGLYPTLSIATVLLVYGFASLLQGSGYLAVYIAGIVLGNHDFINKRTTVQFYEGLGWIMQIVMFITLGMLVDIDILLKVAPLGIVLSLVLMLFARPISVLLALARSHFSFKQKAFISWVGLRGAVPIVFATYLFDNHNMAADGTTWSHVTEIFHLIVFVVLTSIIVQGSSLYPLAQWWHLNENESAQKKGIKHTLQMDQNTKRMLIQLEVPSGSPAHEKKIVDIGLPNDVLIVLNYRNNRYFTVRGDTVILEQDKLFFVINTKKELKQVKACLEPVQQ